MCGERWRKDCRGPCLLPRDCWLSHCKHSPYHRPSPIARPPLSDRSPSAVDIGYCGHGTPPGRQTHPLRPWRRWCVGGERYRRCRFACVRATTEALPIPSPRAIAESTPSKSNQSASSRPVDSSADSAVFNQIPPLPPPSTRPADQLGLLLQGTPTSSPISPPFRHSGFPSPAPNPYPAPP